MVSKSTANLVGNSSLGLDMGGYDPAQGKWRYKFDKRLKRLFRPVLKSSRPPPTPNEGKWEQLKYEMLLPPTGLVAHTVTVLFVAIIVWCAMWSLLTKDMLPYGNMFGLYILVVFALLAGYAIDQIRLAPLLGMLIVGCIFRNVQPINFAQFIDPTWSSSLRSVALAVILTRAGLGLDQAAIKKRFWACISLAFIPTLAISAFITVLAHYMINFPWVMAGALGFLISAVSPAVIVPIMLYFQDQKIGTTAGLPSLVIAAATICDVIAICGNGILLGIGLSSGSLTFNAIAGPLSVVVGIAIGILFGVLLWYFPSGDDGSATIFRFILLLSGGILCIFGSKIAHITGAGAIGALATPLIASHGWRKRGYDKSIAALSAALKTVWIIFQPLLFGLIGATVDFKTLIPEKVGMMIGLLFAAHVVQFIFSWIATCGFGFTWKENLFFSLSFLPKATIQAAIGSTALDTALKAHMSEEFVQLGRDTLNCAVLAIIFFAPIGGVSLLLSGPKLLDREEIAKPAVDHSIEMNRRERKDSGEELPPVVMTSVKKRKSVTGETYDQLRENTEP